MVLVITVEARKRASRMKLGSQGVGEVDALNESTQSNKGWGGGYFK